MRIRMDKRFWLSLMIMALLIIIILLSACGRAKETEDESLQSEISSPSITGTDIREESSEMPSAEDSVGGAEALFYENAYEAYSAKCSELSKKYGSGRLVEHTDDGGLESGCYMSGLCIVDLIDFDGGREKDLLVVYAQGENTGVNGQGKDIPQAGNYRVEIWTYEEGYLKPLVSVDHASSYLYFKTEYWDTDNCFLTVYEYDGRALIQIYEESPEGDVFTNYYCSPYSRTDEPECAIYTSRDGKFYENEEEIPELRWYMKVCGYDTILAAIQLSSSEYGRERLAKFGVDMSYGLDRSMKNMQDLSDGTFQTMMKVSGEYFPAYMQTLLEIRYDTLEEGGGFREPGFTLYDMDGNGVPELIVNISPSEAGSSCQVYTYVRDQAVECGEGYSGHSTFYSGPGGGMVRTEGHMDVYHYEKWDLQGSELVITEFARGTAEREKGYPSLDDYGYQVYDREVWFWHGDYSTLFYMSGMDALESVERFEEAASATADTQYQYVYEDLDRDGEKEFVAVTEERGYEVWYCGSDGSRCEKVCEIDQTMDGYGLEILRLESETHVAVNRYNMIGDAKKYSILALKEGGIKSLVSDHWGYVYQNGDGDIVMDIEAYDGCYDADLDIHIMHTWKDTYLYYDGEKYREYGAAVLTEEEFLKSYANGLEVLDKIRQSTELAEGESLELTSIFVRGNGIVQIQCEYRYAYGNIDFFYYEYKSDEHNKLSGGKELNYGQMGAVLSQLEASYPVF